MKQKGELTLTVNKFNEKKQEKEASENEIKKNEDLLDSRVIQGKQLMR